MTITDRQRKGTDDKAVNSCCGIGGWQSLENRGKKALSKCLRGLDDAAPYTKEEKGKAEESLVGKKETGRRLQAAAYKIKTERSSETAWGARPQRLRCYGQGGLGRDWCGLGLG